MVKEDFKNVIWTDNERTRFILWEAYEGFIQFYNKYMMYSSLDREDPVSKAGLNRYANFFFEEIRCFLPSFQEIKVAEIQKLQYLFDSKAHLRKNDFVYLRRFFSLFMYVSGIKNIIMVKDQRNNYTKLRHNLGLDNKKEDD